MNQGWVKFPRGWMDNPLFEDEPFSEREAWAWLMEQAAYKARAITLKNGKEFELQRGELLTSLRTLATEWGWASTKRVRTFLRKLNQHSVLTVILAQPGTHTQTHIRLDNYNRIQNSGHTKDTDEDTDRTQTGHIPKKDKKEKKEGRGAARPPPAVDPPEEGGEDPDKYAWEGLVVRLTHRDYDNFFRQYCEKVKPFHRNREKFNEIISGADAWFVGDDPKERKRWFFRLGQWIDREIEIKKLRPPHIWEIAG